MKFHILIPQEIWIDDDDVAKLCKRIKDRYAEDAFDDDQKNAEKDTRRELATDILFATNWGSMKIATIWGGLLKKVLKIDSIGTF
jgi:hypothetical protein